MVNFWALRWRRLKDDYEQFFVNGHAQYRFSIPGIECPKCGCAGGGRVLPFECPKEFRQRQVLRKPQVLPVEEHKALCSELEKSLRRVGVQTRLESGDQFQPALFNLPSLPSVDFFWAYAGARSVIISERVRTLFEDAHVRGAMFCPVVLRKIGRLAVLPEDLHELCPTGEPMEMLMSAETVRQPSPYKFYDMLPSTEPVGIFKLLVDAPLCPLCGLPQGNDDPDLVEAAANEFTIDRDLAQKIDLDFFFLADVGLAVSVKVREIILTHKLSNCDLVPLSCSG